jgi:hypothetical protein
MHVRKRTHASCHALQLLLSPHPSLRSTISSHANVTTTTTVLFAATSDHCCLTATVPITAMTIADTAANAVIVTAAMTVLQLLLGCSWCYR